MGLTTTGCGGNWVEIELLGTGVVLPGDAGGEAGAEGTIIVFGACEDIEGDGDIELKVGGGVSVSAGVIVGNGEGARATWELVLLGAIFLAVCGVLERLKICKARALTPTPNSNTAAIFAQAIGAAEVRARLGVGKATKSAA